MGDKFYEPKEIRITYDGAYGGFIRYRSPNNWLDRVYLRAVWQEGWLRDERVRVMLGIRRALRKGEDSA